MQNVRNIAEQLALEAEEIAYIVYRNDNLGIDGRRFKHIDVELIYGECIELVEADALYQEIYIQGEVAETKGEDEVILYQKNRLQEERN